MVEPASTNPTGWDDPITAKRAELLRLALPADLIESAIKRAVNKARMMADRIPQERDAYRVLLAAELTTCEAWVRGYARSVAE